MNETRAVEPGGLPWRRLWIGSIAAVGVFLTAATLFQTHARWLRFFNLRDESNLAALWSGMLLLLAALHCFDGWILYRSRNLATARAWLGVGAALTALSFDEIGSLHERIPPLGGHSWWLSMLPFGLVLAGLAAYGAFVLLREPDSRGSAIGIGLGFSMFGAVALQEYIEHRVEWPTAFVWVRGAIEEGSELLGMTILVWATMPNTHGLLSRARVRSEPVFEALVRYRTAVAATALVAAPVAARATELFPPGPWGHGRPADWPAAALLFAALLATLRPFLRQPPDRATPGALPARQWALAALTALGLAATIVRPLSPKVLPGLALLSAAGAAIWWLDARPRRRAALPATLACALAVALLAVFRESVFASCLASQYVALGFYWVASSGGVETPRSSSA